MDPAKEEAKRRLARDLVAAHPTLRIAERDFAELATLHHTDISEAKRRFRDIELNEEQYSIQITLFDDTAGVSFAFAGEPEECARAIALLWDCLRILRARGGFSAYDPQLARLLNLDADSDLLLRSACGGGA